SPFFKAFLVMADVPEIYMQEFWATSYVHQHSIRFKMDTRKNIVDLEAFREMLHISPRVPGQSFDELPFEEEILDFLWFLGHSAQIKTLSDFQVISSANLIGVISQKKHLLCLSNLGRFCVSNETQELKEKQRDVLPKIYKSHHSSLHDEETFNPKTKQRKQPARATSPNDPSEVERTEAEQLKIVLKRSRQETHISQHGGSSTNEGTGSKLGVLDVPYDDSEEEISWNSSDDEEETESNEESANEETREEEEESFDPILRTPEDSKDDGNGKEDQGLRVSEEQRLIEEEEADELYRDQESLSVSSFVTSMLNPISDAGVESIFTTASSPIAPLQTSTPIMTPSTIATITTSSDAPIPPTIISSAVIHNLPTFDSVFRFEERVKSLEVNFSEFMQTNQFAEAVSNISGIVHQYMTQQMTEAVREAVQIQTDQLQDSFQRENDEFLRTINENMKKIIKGQVKSQVKEQVSWILPRIEESVNAQLEAEVLTRSSHSSRTSYAVAADLTEMELKKILMEKREGNKSIQRSDEQRNLYKALEGPSAGSDRGSKRLREGGEPESASTPSEPATRSASRSTTWTQSRQMSASESAFAEEPVQTTCQMDEPPHPVFETGVEDQPITPELLAGPTYELMRGSCTSLIELEYHLEEVYKATTDQLDWINPEGQQYPHNLPQPLPLIPDNQGGRVIPFAHFINNDLEYLRRGASSQKYITSMTKTKAFYGFAVNRESGLNVYSKRRIIAVTNLKIVEWHNYKHLD
nr:hypothetical protein [Tanacetum cinerariifolium]